MTVVVLTTGTSWTVPAGVTTVQVECWGGGGQGGNAWNVGNGGGGGAYARKNALTTTPGASITYQIGQGGQNIAANQYGGGDDGTDTWFSSSATVLAKAGLHGTTTNNTPGLGGSATSSIGDVKFAGGRGGNAPEGGPNFPCGGGGGAGGKDGAGVAGGDSVSTALVSGAGGAGDNGSGGAGSARADGTGNQSTSNGTSNVEGGGGSGGCTGTGSATAGVGGTPGGGGGGTNNGTGNAVGGFGGVGQIRLTFTSATQTVGEMVASAAVQSQPDFLFRRIEVQGY